MQFLIIGYDGIDEEASKRRLSAREAHLALGDKMRAAKQLLYAVAILDESDKMIGSVMVCEFESRKSVDEWLEIEPYVVGNVWQKIEIRRCKVGPSFATN